MKFFLCRNVSSLSICAQEGHCGFRYAPFIPNKALDFFSSITIVFVHLSCQGLHGFPRALKAQKGTARLNPLANAVEKEILLPSMFTALVPVINLPRDLPFERASTRPIYKA